MNRSSGYSRGVLRLAGPFIIAIAIWSPAVMGQCVTNELAKLTASDAEAGDEFARAVAISGDIAVIGARRDDTEAGGWESGTARVYRLAGTQWIEETTLISSDIDEQDWFGISVAVSGDAILVGAPADDDDDIGFSGSGSAYVFRFNGREWVQEDKLTASDPAGSDHFGWSVSIRGDVAVVGAPSNTLEGTGKAYVYRFNGAKWIEEVNLLAFDADDRDQFGNSVAISGDVAVIGAIGEGNVGDPWGTGAVYMYRFDQETGQWNGEGKLTPPPVAPNFFDRFGRSVAIREDAQVIVIGADPLITVDPLNPLPGPVIPPTAFVYRFDPDACEAPGPECTPWIKEADLLGSGEIPFGFGYSVSISGDMIVSGAWAEYEGDCPFPLNCSTGAAYVFRFDGVDWIEQAKFKSSDLEVGDLLGWSVAVSGDIAVIGAWRDDDAGADSGSAYIVRGLSDCNNNGVLDLCDIADGTSSDANTNGIPDECEPPACPADLDGDGRIGVKDLLILLGAWGPCPKKGDCPADFDNTGDVGVKDLLLLLGAWGVCP